MATLAEIKAKLEAQKARTGGNNNNQQSTGGDNASYPFWNMNFDQSATVRFLPDADESNDFFWVKREVIKLPFDGVEGGDNPSNKPVEVTVPCLDMWQPNSCPIIQHTKSWWKTDKEEIARRYWKKKSYIFQGFVINSPFEEQTLPENPIRRFMINASIYEIIEKSLLNPEMEDMPTDFTGGRDFKIQKTKKGEYANYGTSQWSMRTRALNEQELIAIDQHKLYDLKEYQGKRPDADGIEAIKAMFLDSLDGKPFDMESYGKYYRPYGTRFDNGNAQTTSAPKTQSTGFTAPAAAKAEDTTVGAAEASAPATEEKKNTDDIIARIMARKAAAQ
jgi:hypothetical protein